MASGLFASPPTPPPVQAAARAASGSAAGYDQYVEQQLRKTRTQVKLVDIVSNSLVLICGALAYMLAVALVDHWLVTLSFAARMLALAVLVAGCGWWLYVRIMPLIVRRINPVYAALTIERAEPSLKNSLINFLLLRGQRSQVHEVVYQALGQRAATDLSHMPAETVVDYNPLIRIGYVLAGLVIFGAAYKILSPKDPVQSVARVMAPWADIARASRVAIDDVRPGEAKIFQGDHVEVSAILRGIRASDNVRVVFSTIDGQVLDQEVQLSPDSAGLRHLAKIPADDMGAQSSLQYKLVAGDAETKWYNVEVAPAPHVLVTKVEYDPPAYTKLAAEESAHGDISGLEGTKVTLFARANREIESAYLEFDPVLDPKAATPDSGTDARSLRITQIDGQDLQVSFQLRLSDKRDAAWHKHYTIRYKSKEGHRNTRPIFHTLSVKPDLAPLAEILSPSVAEREKTVPQNRMVEIEAKGIDLDFALTKLRLVAVSGGRDVMDVALLDSLAGQSGQVIKKLEFTPSHYALAVGDVVEYWAVAEDNRHSPRSARPEPNVTSSTPTYRLIIGPPEVQRATTEDEEKSDEGERGEGEEAEASGGGAPQQSPMNGSGENSESGDSGEKKPSESDMGGGESGESGSSGGAQEGSEEGNSRSANGQRDSEDSEGEGEASESSEGGAAGNSGASSSKPSESNSGEGGAESSSEASESNGSQSSNSRSANGQRNPDSNQEGASESTEPLASDGSQDGDAFEKIQQHRQQQDSQGQEGSSESGSPQSNSRSANGQRDAQSEAESSPSDAGQSSQNGSQQDRGNSSAGNSDNQQGQKPDGQQGQKPDGEQNGEQSAGAQGGSQGANSEQANSPSANGQRNEDGQKNGGEQGGQEGNQSGGQQQGKKPEQGKSGGEQQNQGGQNDQGQNKNASGRQEGGQPQGGAKPEGDKPSNQGGGEQPKESSGGQGQNDKSGAGQESQQGGGSPESQAVKPQQKNGGEKSGGQQGGGQKKEEGGKSPSGSNKNSNSQGESGGDRSGGGEQGGGQGAKKPGNDTAGSSSAGEQGDGAANEPGSGESGSQGGGDQVADKPTGHSGEQTGEGSSSGSAEQGGEKPQPKSGNSQGGESSSSGKQPGGSRPKEGEQGEGQGEQISDTPGEGRGTLPTGGGKPADNHPSDTPLADVEPGSDAANLDYARKSTDLTLEYLKNQKHNPDPKLLDELGWTKDDLAKFIDRWDRMQRDAKTDGSGSAKRKLDDSLRSLGLRPRTSQVRTDDAGGTRLNNQRETGARTRPPKEYADQYRAFSKFITPAKE